MQKLKSLLVVCASLAALFGCPSPALAAVAQQVQSGTLTNTTNGTQTVTISSVVMSKSVLFFSSRHAGDRPVSSLIRGRLASATTIQFVRVTNEGAPAAIDIQWYLVSFGTGVSVQRGEVAQASASIDVPIAAVASLNQAFVLFSKTATAGDLTWGDDDPILGELISTTNLQFRPTTATATHIIAWQVVEFTDPADINVQRGTAAMTGGALTATATLAAPVNLMKTFVLAGFRATGSDDNVGSRMVEARLTSPTTIEFARGTAGSADIPEIAWQAVEFKDKTNVYSGSSTFASGQSSTSTLLTTASRINSARAVAFGSVQSGAGQNTGSTAYAASDITGVASATASLGIGFRSAASDGANSGNLTIDRPAGTLEGDVMIAAFGISGNVVSSTPPSGWTLIRRTNRTTTNSTLTYWKLATNSEPATYTWNLGTNGGSAGGILSFVGVDAVDPIDVDNGVATASSTSHAAPSVTTTAPNEMIVTVHSYRSSQTWTPPAGMTEAVDIASRAVPNNNGQSTEVNYVMQSSAGATGTKTAVAGGGADTGATQTLALRASKAASHINLMRSSTVAAADLSWFVVEFDRGGGFAKGSFVKKNNGTGTQVIPHTLGEMPKAMILWTVGRDDENFGDHHWSSIGFAAGAQMYAAGTYARAGSTNVGRRMVNGRVLTLLECPPTCAVVAEATVTAVDETSITLNWTINNANAAVVHYILIGGANVEANVVNWQTRDSTGNLAVNGVGFQPDGVFSVHIGSGYTVALGTNNTTSALGLGLMTRSSAKQWTWGYVSGGGNARRGQATDGMLITHDTGGTVTKKASFVSMDTDGFTVNFSASTSANEAQVMSLALKGINIDAGAFNKSTAAQPASQSITGVGFVPSVAMLTSFQDTALGGADVDGRYGLGATDGVNVGSSAVADVSGATRRRSIDKTSKVFMKVNSDPAAIDAEALMTSLDPDGFTLNWTTNDAVATQILYAAMAPMHVTAVRLLSFDAARYNRGVLLGWRTGYEVDNIGFHVFREIDGRRTRVNAALVAGTALASARGTAVRSEQQYALWDLDGAAFSPAAVYWLADVDMNGKTTWHGPVTPVDVTTAPPETPSTMALHDVGRGADRNVFVTRGEEDDAQRGRTARPGRAQASLEAVFNVAQMPALKIGIRTAGWYRIAQPEIAAAGFNTATDPRTLRLLVDGAEHAMRVNGEGDGQFDPADSVEFYATGVDTPYTDTRVYWLVSGTGSGARMATIAAPDAGPVAGPPSFASTMRLKERSIFFAGLKNGETENWFGALVSSSPTDLPLTVSGIDPAAETPSELEVTLQGVTSAPDVAPDHRVAVIMNGVELGEMAFDGTDLYSQTFAVPAGALVEGANTLRLVSLAGDSDFTLVDVIRLTYAHRYTAEGDSLRFTALNAGPLTINGFTGSGVRVVDITDPAKPIELAGRETAGAGGLHSVTIDAQGPGQRTMLAFVPATVAAAASLRLNEPSQWRTASLAHDYVMVVHPDFAGAVAPLVALRAEQGHHPAVVKVEDIYDEFSFGQKTPQAMKDFFTWTRANWSQAPRWGVLVGDATTDPRNYSGLGEADFVPTRLVPMEGVALETASDDWFADADGDGLTEIAIGRLPVRTVAHAQTMVAKIVDYERTPAAPWTRNVLFVADKSDPAADFSANAARLAAQLPAEYTARTILRDEMDLADARQALTGAVNDGQLFVNYDGHGSVNIWGGNDLSGELLTREDVRNGWTNASRLPVAVLMNCLNGLFNGYFDEESLAETLLRSPNGGAVAAWASSSVTPSATQARVNEEFYRLVFHGLYATVGEAAAAAKRVVTSEDLRRSWIFFGDPAMRLSGLVTVTDPVELPALAPTAIATQPVHQVSNRTTPEPASFSCSATGESLTFRWEEALYAGDWTPVQASFVSSAATSSRLTIPSGQTAHFGRYRCTVENPAGGMTSDTAIYVNAQVVATPGQLRFGALSDQAGPVAAAPAQRVTVNVQGPSSHWTAVADMPWVQITGGQGTGPGAFSVSIDAATAPAGDATAAITISEASLPFSVVVPLAYTAATGAAGAPFGFVDAPQDNASVSGAFAISGWALDDVGVARVEVWRDCTAADRGAGTCGAAPLGGSELVFIGVGTFVAGARPDVELAYPTMPRAGRAGWGLMILSNAFPRLPGGGSGGQGDFTLHAFAVDEEGLTSLIGSKVITVDNDSADLPFGTIDTPSSGETMTAPVLVNFGWAMTPAGKCIDTTSETAYQVFIDGIARPIRSSGVGQNWYPGLYRPDLAAQFPGLCNTNNALAAYYIDATELELTVGLHTIVWVVTDSEGRTQGIGSRYFEVLVDSSDKSGVAEGSRAAAGMERLRTSARTIRARTGFDDGAGWLRIGPDARGRHELVLPTGGRVVIDLGGKVAAGYEVVGDELRSLPTGATFDPATGRFAWQPPVGFFGEFRIAFTSGSERIDIVVTVGKP